MKRIFLVIGIALLLTNASYADESTGSFCKISSARISNPAKGVVVQKLWEYTAPTVSATPVIGWVDAACADRGVSRSQFQEFGKRIWFSISGAEGAAASTSRIYTNDAQLSGADEASGVSVKGMVISGQVTSNHDCVYEISLWKSQCQ